MSVLGCTKRTIRPHPRLSDIGKSGHWSALGLNGSVANDPKQTFYLVARPQILSPMEPGAKSQM